LGYQVGVRILLDVLNATTQLVQTQRDLKRARYDFLLAALRLKASTGSLTDEDVAAVNALLDAAVPLTVPDVSPNTTSLRPPPANVTAPAVTPPAAPPPATPPASGSAPAATKPARAKRR
jgi:outer membrane protein